MVCCYQNLTVSIYTHFVNMNYKLKYKGEEIDELLDQVDKKTIYNPATKYSSGLMTAKDKRALENISEVQSITNIEILNLFR